MSLVSIFVDAFNKARNKKPEVDMKTYGPMGSTFDSAAGSFEPIKREAPETGSTGAVETDTPPAQDRPAG